MVLAANAGGRPTQVALRAGKDVDGGIILAGYVTSQQRHRAGRARRRAVDLVNQDLVRDSHVASAVVRNADEPRGTRKREKTATVADW